jgi:hypothetical protein
LNRVQVDVVADTGPLNYLVQINADDLHAAPGHNGKSHQRWDVRMFKLNFDFIRDIAPIATICRVPLVMEVHVCAFQDD